MTTAMVRSTEDSDNLNRFKSLLQRSIPKIQEACGKAMKAEDMYRLAVIAASRSPDLARCTGESIVRAMLDAAALGIRPGGMQGRGYLVPRRNNKTGQLEMHFDPGYRGLIDIARRTGQLKRIEAYAVYERDTFEVEFGTAASIKHKPCLDGDPGRVVAAYAVAELQDGAIQIEVLRGHDLAKIRSSRATRSEGIWGAWEEEMARKSAVRRIAKYLPYDDNLERATELSLRAEVPELADLPEPEPPDVAPPAALPEASHDDTPDTDTPEPASTTASPTPDVQPNVAPSDWLEQIEACKTKRSLDQTVRRLQQQGVPAEVIAKPYRAQLQAIRGATT